MLVLALSLSSFGINNAQPINPLYRSGRDESAPSLSMHRTQTNPPLQNITAITAGMLHTCALTSTGGVKCWGDNFYYQLGDGSTTDRNAPGDVSGLSSVAIKLSAGTLHTCALMSGGTVKCWGANGSGQLGDGTAVQRTTPVEVSGLTGVTALALGAYHTCALISTGGVKCWGYNYNGQLGDGTNAQSSTPVQVAGLTSGVKALVAGGYHTCALTNAGGVKCWGWNQDGQLGDGTYTDRSTPVDMLGLTSGVTSISAGIMHTCALTPTPQCWGANSFGQLGDGTTTKHSLPVDVVGLGVSLATLEAGDNHTCALTRTGGVKCWGYNSYGQIGDGTQSWRNTPVDVSGLGSGVTALAAGGMHTCTLTAAGGVKCWGDNYEGQIGDGALSQRSHPVDVIGITDGITKLEAGGWHTCAILSGVKCWGDNSAGQLGTGANTQPSTPVDVVGLPGSVTDLAAGDGHTCATTSAGGVKCWGLNEYGQLGNGDTSTSNVPVDVVGLASGMMAVTAGDSHTCALTSAGKVKCWGLNIDGQLGDGTSIDSSTPVNVNGLAASVIAIEAGSDHTCALISAGGVKCWGNNESGQLGDGTVDGRLTPVDVLGLTSGVALVAAGGDHTCALTTAGGVKCWGANSSGQLGDSSGISSTVPVDVPGLTGGVTALAAGWGYTCAITNLGEVRCWGTNMQGQLGDGTVTERLAPVGVVGLERGASAITLGNSHTCALVGSGRPRCWGSDETGQLGIGTQLMRLAPVEVVDFSATLTLNYPHGAPGSFFTLTGDGFPPTSTLMIMVNNAVLTDTLTTTETGGFVVFLDTVGADAGGYFVTTSITPGPSAFFTLELGAPPRQEEGGGATNNIPGGIATIMDYLYLPLIRR
jgi:alpha-tubulin suppressor-like RCC1 family protein